MEEKIRGVNMTIEMINWKPRYGYRVFVPFSFA